MNLQDIADFLDLVKNPAKYEQVLTNIRQEQDRLNAVVATVGKASELDKLRKEVEKERDSLAKQYETINKERDLAIQAEVATLATKRKTLDAAQAKADQKTAEAESQLASAKELAAGFAGRDKALKQAEANMVVGQAQLEASIKEYNEKLTKLRSVMN